MAVCVLINIYGVRFATMVNNIGVSLELVITVGATAPDRDRRVLRAGEPPADLGAVHRRRRPGTRTPTSLAWLAAALGPFFGLIGVESSADVAEETKDARRVMPRTMFYALATSIVIELLMYVVYVLAIKDAAAVEANAAAPIEEIITQQAGPVVTKIVVAVALTNILACMLANILVATRLTYSMARDNMLPFSHVWRHVSPTQPHAHLRRARAGRPVDDRCCSRRWSTRRRSPHPRHRVAGGSSRLHPADHRRCSSATAAAPSPPPSPARSTSAGAGCRSTSLGAGRVPSVCAALIFLPQFAGNGGCSSASSCSPALWCGHRAAQRGCATGEAGPDYAKTHVS